MSLKIFYSVLFIYALPAVIFWAVTFLSEPLPYDLSSNGFLYALLFGLTALIAPVFFIVGGTLTITLGIFYYVMAYGLLYYSNRKIRQRKAIILAPFQDSHS